MTDVCAGVHPHDTFGFNPDFYSMGIPLLLLILPWVVTRVLRTEDSVQFPYWPNFGLLFAVAMSWFWALQLPNLPISCETPSTTVHLLGGLLIGPLLFLYFLRAYRFKRPESLWMRYLVFYGAIGGLFGTTNELMEFFGARAGLLTVQLSDTSWDIAENWVGLTIAFIVLELRYRRGTFYPIPAPQHAAQPISL